MSVCAPPAAGAAGGVRSFGLLRACGQYHALAGLAQRRPGHFSTGGGEGQASRLRLASTSLPLTSS